MFSIMTHISLRKLLRPTLYASACLSLAMSPVVSNANEVEREPLGRKESLQQTETRLNALIKAAARQDLVNMNTPKLNVKPAQKNLPEAVKTPTACQQTDMFTFPPASKIRAYSDLQTLKQGVFTGADQIDMGQINMGQAKLLTSAFLGLGFAQEALNAANMLGEQDKVIASIMANALLEMTKNKDIAIMRAQAACNPEALSWLYLMQDKHTAPTDEHIRQYLAHMKTLPEYLRNIFGQKLGIKAAQYGDLKTAKTMHHALVTMAPEPDDLQPFSIDLKFFDALLAVNSEDDATKIMGIKKIKYFAKKQGGFQAYALQALAKHAPKDESFYPGYIQDLDAAAQIYSTHPIGKQAQVQKIDILVRNRALQTAIDQTKISFVPSSVYFKDTLTSIGGAVKTDLLGSDENRQIWALEILIREQEFFSQLTNIDLLKQAGIHACATLGLPELAVTILPTDKWKSLDTKTLNVLARSFLQYQENHTALDNFPDYVFTQPAFKAKAIKLAFAEKTPTRALAIQRQFVDNTGIQNEFIKHAWQNGYWSLADNAYRDKIRGSATTDGQLSGVQIIPEIKQKLAATLSVVSPLLLTSGRSYAINDLTALQTHLNNELTLFKSYLKPGKTIIEGGANG